MHLKNLPDTILLEVLNEISKLSTNITIPWVKVPILKHDDIIKELLEMRDVRVTKPIFIINLQRDIKEEMSRRWIEMVSIKNNSIELVV